MKVRDLTQRLIEMIENGKADWDLIFEERESQNEVLGCQLTAVKPKGMEVLFG